jgi:hypothetical protein
MKTPKTRAKQPAPAAPKTKLEALIGLLARESGADLAEMMAVTGWQAHSVRGALAGSLKKKGIVIESAKVDGRRVYRGALTKAA